MDQVPTVSDIARPDRMFLGGAWSRPVHVLPESVARRLGTTISANSPAHHLGRLLIDTSREICFDHL